jgi:hypothetical protein
LRNLMRCFLEEKGRVATTQNGYFISISPTWHLCFTICCYCSIIIISEEDQRDNGPKHHHHLLIADFFITLSLVSINKVPNCHVHLFTQYQTEDHFENSKSFKLPTSIIFGCWTIAIISINRLLLMEYENMNNYPSYVTRTTEVWFLL